MSTLISESIQVGESPETSLARIKNSSNIYSQRKDCLLIKNQLIDNVTEPDYWNTLACFLHGQCSKQIFDEKMHSYLKTPEAKVLHNQLIRSIIYNAHFSMIPPPNVTLPRPAVPTHIKKTPPVTNSQPKDNFMTYTASDLRHLPSINQLHLRIKILLSSRDFDSDTKATCLIFQELKKFILFLLESSVSLLSFRGSGDPKDMTITTDQVLHVLNNNQRLAGIVSSSVITKFATTTQ
ncbi:hypothetical protein M9Y10_008923 [Tritrichomonas musculus]|uniref:Uncharacterized protein n=1 Tax=Tritrichomonas musculus TaxID=1915356 RepID=A0ABR2IZF3_9EUKA